MSALRGLRVLLTRTERGCAEWAPAVEAAGAIAVTLPCIRTEILASGSSSARLRAALIGAQWLALASATAVRAVDALLGADLPDVVRLAVVGPGTARECRARLGRIDLQAREGTGAGLARDLAALASVSAAPHRTVVTTAAAAEGLRSLEEILEPLGVTVRRVPVYRTTPATPAGARPALDELADVVLLASPSAVRGLVNLVAPSDAVRVVTIGPTTTAAATAAGLRVDGESDGRSLEAMLGALP